MNKRIQKLAKQAGFGLRRDGEIYTSRLEHLPITEDLAKFAELILIEVTDILSTYRSKVVFTDGAEYNYEHPIIAIRKHFGVE